MIEIKTMLQTHVTQTPTPPPHTPVPTTPVPGTPVTDKIEIIELTKDVVVDSDSDSDSSVPEYDPPPLKKGKVLQI